MLHTGQIIIRPEFLLRPQCGTHWPLMRVDDHTERAQGFIELDVRSVVECRVR